MMSVQPNRPEEFALSRRRLLQSAATLAAVAVCTSVGLAWAEDKHASGAAAVAQALILTTPQLSDSLEPGRWHGLGMVHVFDYVGGYLTRPNSSGLRRDPPEGGVAASWTVSPDGLLYTFTLRPGLTFHDGTKLDAAAVVRSLTRQVNPTDPSYAAGCELHTNYTFNRRSISAPNSATVVMELTRPDPAYLYRLFHPAAMILSPTALDQCRGGIHQRLISCGPYQIERFVPKAEVTLAAFAGFWGERPAADRLLVRS